MLLALVPPGKVAFWAFSQIERECFPRHAQFFIVFSPSVGPDPRHFIISFYDAVKECVSLALNPDLSNILGSLRFLGSK